MIENKEMEKLEKVWGELINMYDKYYDGGDPNAINEAYENIERKHNVAIIDTDNEGNALVWDLETDKKYWINPRPGNPFELIKEVIMND